MEIVTIAAWAAFGYCALFVMSCVHLIGQFITASLFGRKAKRFVIGFGRQLVVRTYRDTEYTMKMFPIGGHLVFPQDEEADEERVRLTEEQLEQRKEQDEVVEQTIGMSENLPGLEVLGDQFKDRASIHQRLAMAISGPLTSAAVGFLGFVAAGFFYGATALTATIGTPTGLAAASGIQEGDTIVAIDGQPVGRWPQADALAYAALTGPEEMLTLTVRREGGTRDFAITPDSTYSDLRELGMPHKEVRFSMSESVGGATDRLLDVMMIGRMVAHSVATNLGGSSGPSGPQSTDDPSEEPAPDETALPSEGRPGALEVALNIFAIGNLLYAAVGLIPIPPFDGGTILNSMIRVIRGRSAPGLEFALTLTGVIAATMVFVSMLWRQVQAFLL